MIKINRVYAIVLRYFYLLIRSLDRLSDLFYWPAVDLLLWGLTSAFFKKSAPNMSFIIIMIISGLILWIILWRGQYEITVNLLEDLWDQNLVNVFVSPIRLNEWMISFVVIGILKAAISVSFAGLLALLLYKIDVFRYGFLFLPLMVSLIMSGWWIGFIVAGLILRFGRKIQTFAWSVAYLFAPFSAVYYPVSILPEWAQRVASLLPMSYVFESMRKIIESGKFDLAAFSISLGLNILYLILALIFFKKSFEKALDNGLGSLTY